MCLVVIFFFKQKTAYEMRISDWSSDVCSSDLLRRETCLCRLCEPVDPECGRALADRRLRRDDVEAEKRAAEQFERERYSRCLQALDISKRLIDQRPEKTNEVTGMQLHPIVEQARLTTKTSELASKQLTQKGR